MPPHSSNTPLPENWYRDHFDHFDTRLADDPQRTLAKMRKHCPVTHSDQYGGFWVATRYRDIWRVAQDWRTFSSERGMTVPSFPIDIPVLPEQLDPPRHRAFKDLIAPFLTPAAVAANQAATRELIDELFDGFITQGHCDFMADFAVPMPGRIFFEHYLNAPRDDLETLHHLASQVAMPGSPDGMEARGKILDWIRDFVAQRRSQTRRDDLVDAIIHADIEGRPITDEEMLGVIQLLIFGGLDTTTGALGHMMIRFCRQPEIPQLLRRQPALIDAAVDELLRLDSPFVYIARTATCDTELGGQTIREGEQVLLSWLSGNRDESVFPDAEQFDPQRSNKRHMAFGTGPHRCAGANLALLNLRLSVEQLVNRLDNLHLAPDAGPIQYPPGFSRSPLSVPIRFEPGEKRRP